MRLKQLFQSRFFVDSATLQVAALFRSTVNLASTFALAHVLGATLQGEYYLAVATYSFLWFAVNLGLQAVTTSQVAAAAARGNEYKVAAWLAYLVKASMVLGLAVVALSWLLLPPLAKWAYGDSRLGVFAALLTTTPILELPRAVACAGLQGTRRMLALARVEVASECVRLLLVVAGALVIGSALGPILGSLAATCVSSVLAIDTYRRETRRRDSPLPGLRDVLAKVREVPLKHGLRLGLRMGLVRNVDAYGVQILPPILLGVFGDRAWVAYLRLAQSAVGAARTLMEGINRTALPYFSEIVGLREISRLSRAYWRVTLTSGLLISSGLLLSLPIAPHLIALWPRDYHDPVWICYLILLPGTMVVSFSVANDTFYLVTNTLKVAVQLSVLGLVVNTLVVAFLAWRFPTLGVAVGLSFTYCWSMVHVAYAFWWFRTRGSSVETEES